MSISKDSCTYSDDYLNEMVDDLKSKVKIILKQSPNASGIEIKRIMIEMYPEFENSLVFNTTILTIYDIIKIEQKIEIIKNY